MPFGVTMLSSHKVIMVEFIQLYKSMAFLWDKSHPSYQNRLLRINAYKKLLEKYREIDDEATLPILKGKLDNMRNSYIRELKKVRASRSNGDSDRKYSPSLWYYHQFTFLEDHVLKPRSQERADTDHSLTSAEDAFYGDYDEGNQSKVEYMPVEYLEEFEDNGDSCPEISPNRYQIKEESEDPIDMSRNDWEIIGRAIGVQLRDITPHQAAIAQKLIADTLFYGKLGRLTEDSTISYS